MNAVSTSAATQKVAELRSKGMLRAPRNPLKVHAENRLSLRASINAMCWQCMGGEGSENHVNLIRGCTAPACALFHVRPYQTKGGK